MARIYGHSMATIHGRLKPEREDANLLHPIRSSLFTFIHQSSSIPTTHPLLTGLVPIRYLEKYPYTTTYASTMTHNPTPNSRTPHHHAAPRRSHSILPTTNQLSTATSTRSTSKPRHLSHLHSQLAQLSANLSDLENLLRMTAVQAESMRGLGAWCGGMSVCPLPLRNRDHC